MATYGHRAAPAELRMYTHKNRERVARLTMLSPPVEYLGNFNTAAMIRVALNARHNADDLRHLRSIVASTPELIERAQQLIISGADASMSTMMSYRKLWDAVRADRPTLSTIDEVIRQLLHADDHHRNDAGHAALSAAGDSTEEGRSATVTWTDMIVKMSVVVGSSYALGYFSLVLFLVYATTSRIPGAGSLPSPVRMGLVSVLALPQNISGPLVRSALTRVLPNVMVPIAGVASRNPLASLAIMSLSSGISYFVAMRLTQLATDSVLGASGRAVSRAYNRLLGTSVVEAASQVADARVKSDELADMIRDEVARQLLSIDVPGMVNSRATELITARLDAARGELKAATNEAKIGILEARIHQTDLVEQTVKRRIDSLIEKTVVRVEELYTDMETLAIGVEDVRERLADARDDADMKDVVLLARTGSLERLADMKALSDRGRIAMAIEQ